MTQTAGLNGEQLYMTYDGFGNFTAKVLNGNTTAIPVNGSTNRLANAVYDANGNMTSGAGVMPGYDVANRMTSAQLVSGGTEYYGYAPDNKRIYRNLPGVFFRTTEWTFYGAYGEKLGVFHLGGSPSGASFQVVRASVWFAGRLITEDATNGIASGLSAVMRDRLGTNRAGGARFYPYGEEIGTKTVGDRTKFATYTRDGVTGLDYADQRYYASSYGRFNTSDPYRASAGPSDPGSWNRYAYTRGNPVNRKDPRGLWDCYDCGEGGSLDCDPGYHWDAFTGFCESDNPGGPVPTPPGGNGGNGFLDDQTKQARSKAGSALDNKDCFQLIFGNSKWNTVEKAKGQLDLREVVLQDLGTATIVGTPDNWSANATYGGNNGAVIFLNNQLFPNAILNVFGQQKSTADIFNHTYGTSLNGEQVEEAVILHELWHIAGGTQDSVIDSDAMRKALITTCIK